MKNKMFLIIGLLAAVFIITGCAGGLFGQNPIAPSKFEQSVFDVQTNIIQVKVQVPVTNFIDVPNIKQVLVTNEQNLVKVIELTNITVMPKYELKEIVREVTNYTMLPSAQTKDTIAIGSGILNAYAPGVGTLVGGILGGLLLAWGKMRGAKNAAPVLAQNIETLREFIKTLPDGAKYDKALTDWMAAHQQEAGSLKAITTILDKYVSNPEAKGTVAEIQAAIAALK
jgi:hypothetical protein